MKVNFRKDGNNDIIAIFLDELEIGGNWVGLSCYQHVGQHGSCDMVWVTSMTVNATPAEYADLKTELESIGYELEVKSSLRGFNFYQKAAQWSIK